MTRQLFTITDEHIKLSKRMFVEWDNCEYGAPCIDPKRPYGNSDVESDIAELIGYKSKVDDGGERLFSAVDRKYLRELHEDMRACLQIWLCTGEIRTGSYSKNDRYDDTSWKLVE